MTLINHNAPSYNSVNYSNLSYHEEMRFQKVESNQDLNFEYSFLLNSKERESKNSSRKASNISSKKKIQNKLDKKGYRSFLNGNVSKSLNIVM